MKPSTGSAADGRPSRRAQRGRNAPAWDLLQVQLKARLVSPEEWVPDLAIIMDRYREDQPANQLILSTLVNIGPHPIGPQRDRGGQDGPRSAPTPGPPATCTARRVSTSTGRLGVSATKGGIWTPGGPSSGGGSGLWTPGSPAGQPTGEGEKSKLIIPGR